MVRKIVHLRWKHRLGPIQIGDRLGMPASTVHAVLVRCRLNPLSHLDRATGEPIRRDEHERPGVLLHMDVKKLGHVPTAVAGATWADSKAGNIALRLPHEPAPPRAGTDSR